jgi:hypothetical protein
VAGPFQHRAPTHLNTLSLTKPALPSNVVEKAKFSREAVTPRAAVVVTRRAAAQEATREDARFMAPSNLAVSQEQRQQSAAISADADGAYHQADRDVAKRNLERSQVGIRLRLVRTAAPAIAQAPPALSSDAVVRLRGCKT